MQNFTINADTLIQWVYSFIWPLTRVLAMLAIVPVIGGKRVPGQVKVLIGVMLTLTMLPMQTNIPVVEPWSAAGLFITTQQILIGTLLGFTLLLVFGAINLAGQSIAMSMGLGFSMTSDPQNGFQIPVVSQFLGIIATLLFLALDGHHALIRMLSNSFEILPIGMAALPTENLWMLIEWSSIIFSGAIAVSLPAVIALLATNLVMGVMTRTAPQLNIFSIGFPMTMFVGFVALIFTLPNLYPVFESMLEETFAATPRMLGAR